MKQKLVSITKFEYNNTIYACVSNCYANCLNLANRVANCDKRKYINSYIQGYTNCETFYKFLQNVDVLIRE